MAFLDNDGLLYLWQKIKGEFAKCVKKTGNALLLQMPGGLLTINGEYSKAPSIAFGSGYGEGILYIYTDLWYGGAVFLTERKPFEFDSDYVAPGMISNLSNPKRESDAANKKYVDESIAAAAMPFPEPNGQLVYVRVTNVPLQQSNAIIYDCIVPAWVSMASGASEGRLRLLSPAIIVRNSVIRLGKLYASIIGDYKFKSTLDVEQATDKVNTIIYVAGTGGSFVKKSLTASVLTATDSDWAGSKAGDLMLYVGTTYKSCGDTTLVQEYFNGDTIVLPDFYNVVEVQ